MKKYTQNLEIIQRATTVSPRFSTKQLIHFMGNELRTPIFRLSGLPMLAFFIVLLSSCTTVQVIESGSTRVERYFGFPVVKIQSSENALTAVRLHGAGIMLSDSNFIFGYVDDFTVRQDLTKSEGNCSMIVLVEDDVDATALLQELRINKNKYADVCAVHINSEGKSND